MSASSEVDRIVGDAQWLPLRIAQSLDAITFVHLPREGHREVTFLEERYLSEALPRKSLPIEAVADAMTRLAVPQAPRFIFHSSMATSTLLTRVFDLPGTSMSLAEPIVINELSAIQSRGRDVRAPLGVVLRLLARPFSPGEGVVIKPGNSANNLMPLITELLPEMRAITVHAPLRDFLRALAKRGMFARVIYRRLYAFISRSRQLPTGFSPDDIFEQTDLQIAAMAWLLQHSEFVDMLTRHPAQFRSLDSKVFLASKTPTLDALGKHFGLAIDAQAISEGPVFSTHSKELGRAFSSADRDREHAATDAAHGEEIDMVAQWIDQVAEHVRVPLDLPNPLIPRGSP